MSIKMKMKNFGTILVFFFENIVGLTVFNILKYINDNYFCFG